MIRYRIIFQNSNMEAPEGDFHIGRSLDCHLVLDDPSVSRVHATITRHKDNLTLQDRGSRNGCNLNGHKITGSVPLKDGDEITMGHQGIRISAIRTESGISTTARNTMGIVTCKNCQQWLSMEDTHCASCGRSRTEDTSTPGNPEISPASEAQLTKTTDQTDNTDPSVINSSRMLADLARKAIGRHQNDEAKKLIHSLMESTLKKGMTHGVTEDELETVANLLIELGLSGHTPEPIRDLFHFFASAERLIPRKSVDLLYNSVKKTGYRSCSEMHRYLSLLGEMSRKFSPGEKFVHRRIEGLIGLCG